MIASSTFDTLSRVKPRKQYTTSTTRRIAILENSVRELQSYRSRAGKNKQAMIDRLIAKYDRLLVRLQVL